MKRISAYMRLFRIEHAFMLSAAVLLAELLAARALAVSMPPVSLVIFSLLVPFFIEMGSFALNDYFDIETDRENKRHDRPLVSGELEPEAALYSAVATYVLGFAFAVMLPLAALRIALLFAALSVAYNWKLKELPALGNVYIAASMAIAFIYGNLVISVSYLYPPLLAIAAVAFVAGLGREIIKSAEDVEGDVLHRKARTLPALIGRKNSAYVAAALYAALVPLSFLPFALGLPANLLSVGLVAVTVVAFAALAVSVAKNHAKEDLKNSRKASLLAAAAGLAGYAASLL